MGSERSFRSIEQFSPNSIRSAPIIRSLRSFCESPESSYRSRAFEVSRFDGPPSSRSTPRLRPREYAHSTGDNQRMSRFVGTGFARARQEKKRKFEGSQSSPRKKQKRTQKRA